MRNQTNSNGTSTIRPPQTKTKKPQPKTKPVQTKNHKMPTKGGVKIGQYKNEDKWRCRTCKFMNDNFQIECTTCGDPRPGYQGKKQQENDANRQQGQNCFNQADDKQKLL